MTYEYVCTACGHGWEAEQSISEAPLKTCPNCRAEAAKRQVSGGAGFILKGGGWYADLYSSSKSEKKLRALSRRSRLRTAQATARSHPAAAARAGTAVAAAAVRAAALRRLALLALVLLAKRRPRPHPKEHGRSTARGSGTPRRYRASRCRAVRALGRSGAAV
ncbi:MAG: zinc ribbon domain-containing protein [Polyangiaceae bacterium]